MAGWKQTGALAGVYEWWIPNIVGQGQNRPWRVAPWYSGDAALRNLRYWRDRGVKSLAYETKLEFSSGFPRRRVLCTSARRACRTRIANRPTFCAASADSFSAPPPDRSCSSIT